MRSFNADVDGSFMLVACHEYDQEIEVFHSELPDLKICFEMKIEPGLLKIFDMELILKKEKGNGKLRVISSLDGGLNLEKAKFKFSESSGEFKFIGNAHT